MICFQICCCSFWLPSIFAEFLGHRRVWMWQRRSSRTPRAIHGAAVGQGGGGGGITLRSSQINAMARLVSEPRPSNNATHSRSGHPLSHPGAYRHPFPFRPAWRTIFVSCCNKKPSLRAAICTEAFANQDLHTSPDPLMPWDFERAVQGGTTSDSIRQRVHCTAQPIATLTNSQQPPPTPTKRQHRNAFNQRQWEAEPIHNIRRIVWERGNPGAMALCPPELC